MIDPSLIAVLLGFFVGLLMAVSGAGGTVLSLPLLMYFFDMNLGNAAPIGLLAVSIAAGASTIIGLKQGAVRYRVALFLATFGILLAPVGVALGQIIPAIWLQLLFIIVLLHVGWGALIKPKASSQLQANLPMEHHFPCTINPISSRLFWTASCTKRLLLLGSIAGFLSGLLGVGGGFLVMPSLQKISNLEHRMVVATALAMTALVSLAGVISYASYVVINWAIAIPFVSATLAGSLFGRLLSKRISAHKAKLTFGVISTTIAIVMLVSLITKLL